MSVEITHIPGFEYANGGEALAAIVDCADEVRAAVAFVSREGADQLIGILSGREARASLTARGAPISDPAALTTLEESGVKVSLIVGQKASAFHPKIWLAGSEQGLAVLSGSGNLTAGGMRGNREQFELIRIPAIEQELIAAQEARLAGLIEGAVRLPLLTGTAFWSRWTELSERHDDERGGREAAERELSSTWVEVAKGLLYEDLKANWELQSRLWILHPETGKPKRLSGTGLKAGIDIAMRKGTIVGYVNAIVDKQTAGYSDLGLARRPDLMVESVVLADSPYSFLFKASIKEAARRNLDAYWAKSDSMPGTVPPP